MTSPKKSGAPPGGERATQTSTPTLPTTPPVGGSVTASMVGNAASTETRDAVAGEIVRCIRSGKWRQPVQRIRETFNRVLKEAGDVRAAKRAVDPLKKRLPGVLWSGRFSSRGKPAGEKLLAHAGLLCADLDNLGQRLAEVRGKLATSPHLFALFTSPTGTGLKVVFAVPAEVALHAASFRAIEQHVRDLTGESVDPSCKDLGRLCFVSYDPDAVLNTSAAELRPLSEAPEAPPAAAPAALEVGTRRDIAQKLLGPIRWEGEAHGFCVCPGQHLHTTGSGDRDCEIHLDGAPTVHCFHSHCAGVLAAVNHELRSQVAKAERTGNALVRRRSSIAAEYGLTDDCPTPDALPYTPPPLRLLPPELQDYVFAASDALAVDVSYIFFPLLSALGTAIGNSRIVQLKPGFVQPPIIWSAIVGRSGSKKSPALEEGTFAIRERERHFIRQNFEAQRQYEKQLAEWEAAPREKRGLKPPPPPMRTALMDDLTLASLAMALAENPSLLIEKDELSHWFESFDQFTRAQGADVSRWLSLHTGVLFAFDRKTNRERYRLFNPRVCIAGGIQPKTLRRCLTDDFFDRGLPARFLFAWPPGRQDGWTEKTVPQRIREAAHRIFDRLFALVPSQSVDDERQPTALTLDADAKVEFIAFYDAVGAAAADADDREEAAWHKLTGYGARLALLGELARHDADRISADTMQAATELARWCGAESRRIYRLLAEGSETAALRRLCEFIAHRDGEVTVRDTITYYWPLKNQPALAEAQINQLVRGGLGEWLPMSSTTRGGRPTRRFRLFAPMASPLHLRNPEVPLENDGIADADAGESMQNVPFETKPEAEISEAVLAGADLI